MASSQPPAPQGAAVDASSADPTVATDAKHAPWTRAEADAFFASYVRISPPWDVCEVVRTSLVAVFLLPLRLLFLVIAGGLLWLLAALAMLGVRKDARAEFVTKPLPRGRNLVIRLMFPLMRAIAFVCFGIHRIHRATAPTVPAKASPAESEAAPARAYVVVANHLGYLDILVLLCMHRASFVSKGAFERLPVIGTIAAALQCLFVRPGQSLTTSLVDRVRRTYACHEARATCPGCPACLNKLVIFPEGTTTNGTSMVAFRTGVFNAGVPVRPVCIRFPYRHFNTTWETIRFREHLFRTMTQLYNSVVVTELPVYVPSAEEKEDARLYATNVQKAMAGVLHQDVHPLNREHKLLYHKFLLGRIDGAELKAKAKEVTDKDAQLQYLVQAAVENKV